MSFEPAIVKNRAAIGEYQSIVCDPIYRFLLLVRRC
jgi:hypothetical protein